MNKIVLVIEGGNIVETLSNINIQLVIIDYDLKKVGKNFVFEKWVERIDQSELDKELKKITND